MSSQFAMFVTVIEYLTQYNEIFANLLINISRSLQSRFAFLADKFLLQSKRYTDHEHAS